MRRQVISIMLGGLVSLVMLVAGVEKLIGLEAFAGDISRWQTMPASMKQVSVTLLPPIEVALGIAFFALQKRALVLLIQGGLLALFTVMYSYELASGSAPECGCLGRLAAWASLRDTGWFVISRNAVLLLMVSIAVVLYSDSQSKSASQ